MGRDGREGEGTCRLIGIEGEGKRIEKWRDGGEWGGRGKTMRGIV